MKKMTSIKHLIKKRRELTDALLKAADERENRRIVVEGKDEV